MEMGNLLVQPQELADAMSMVLAHVHDGKFLRQVDQETLFAWVRLNLADRGIYTIPMGMKHIQIVTHNIYLQASQGNLDEALVAKARNEMNSKGKEKA